MRGDQSARGERRARAIFFLFFFRAAGRGIPIHRIQKRRINNKCNQSAQYSHFAIPKQASWDVNLVIGISYVVGAKNEVQVL